MSSLIDGGAAALLPRTSTVASLRRWLLHGLRPLARLIIKSRYRVVLHALENVPERGPVIYAANHTGIMDGPLLAIFSPRPAHALTKIEMFKGFVGWVLDRSGQIPLDRTHVDVGALKVTVRALRDQRAVGIFPEGTRGTGDLLTFHHGAAYLALVTGAPIVPVLMFGTREPGGLSSSLPAKGSTIDIVYGKPIRFAAEPWPRSHDRVRAVSGQLKQQMRAELHEALRRLDRELPGPLPVDDKERRESVA